MCAAEIDKMDKTFGDTVSQEKATPTEMTFQIGDNSLSHYLMLLPFPLNYLPSISTLYVHFKKKMIHQFASMFLYCHDQIWTQKYFSERELGFIQG